MYVGCQIQTVYDGGISFFFQAEDGIRDLVRSRGLGDVYKRQLLEAAEALDRRDEDLAARVRAGDAAIDALEDQILSLIHI